MEPRLTIEPLAGRHDRAAFDCGYDVLNDYIKRYAKQNVAKDFGRTYAATVPDEPLLVGYYTLFASAVALDLFPQPKGMPRTVPLIQMGKLAVDHRFTGRGFGQDLLFHALKTAQEAAVLIGAFAFEVYALDQRAAAFYRHYQFLEFLDDSHHLYLPLATIRTLNL